MSKGQFYITSTLSAAVTYRGFSPSGGDVPVVARSVTIAGGANVQGKLHTPSGVLTVLSAEDYEICEQDPVFHVHKDGGFLNVSQTASDPEAVASDMASRDDMAPLQDGDFDETDPTEPTPVVNGASNTPPPPPASRGRSGRRA